MLSRVNIWRVVLRIIGILLLTTATMKTHGLITDPLHGQLLGFSPGIQLVTIQIELLLGLWLVSGKSSVEAWWVTFFFFLTVTVISARLAWEGQCRVDAWA